MLSTAVVDKPVTDDEENKENLVVKLALVQYF